MSAVYRGQNSRFFQVTDFLVRKLCLSSSHSPWKCSRHFHSLCIGHNIHSPYMYMTQFITNMISKFGVIKRHNFASWFENDQSNICLKIRLLPFHIHKCTKFFFLLMLAFNAGIINLKSSEINVLTWKSFQKSILKYFKREKYGKYESTSNVLSWMFVEYL